jgi:hypothetical protein
MSWTPTARRRIVAPSGERTLTEMSPQSAEQKADAAAQRKADAPAMSTAQRPSLVDLFGGRAEQQPSAGRGVDAAPRAMIPSLFPPLWWTIPTNAAVP